MISQHREWRKKLKTFIMEDNDRLILHSHYHDYRWPGDARSEDIGSHEIDLVFKVFASCGAVKYIIPQGFCGLS